MAMTAAYVPLSLPSSFHSFTQIISFVPLVYPSRSLHAHSLSMMPRQVSSTVFPEAFLSVRRRKAPLFAFMSEDSLSCGEPLDLTEENITLALEDARVELLQIFDETVGITGVAELADLDGPFVKLRLKGRFWHQRSLVLARLANYLQMRIPEILEVEIEDVSQLDDSASNF